MPTQPPRAWWDFAPDNTVIVEMEYRGDTRVVRSWPHFMSVPAAVDAAERLVADIHAGRVTPKELMKTSQGDV